MIEINLIPGKKKKTSAKRKRAEEDEDFIAGSDPAG